jgi:hypothetical protein
MPATVTVTDEPAVTANPVDAVAAWWSTVVAMQTP